MNKTIDFNMSCPVLMQDSPVVLLGHGSGGKLMQDLLEKIFVPAFGPDTLQSNNDSAVFQTNQGKMAFTTDSFVVNPLFFPGGDIGKLAVWGTVNDLAMVGAVPRYLSAGFILEEGLPIESLWKIVLSMQEAALESGVRIITGDTKVVHRGKGDGVFINTSGVGFIEHALDISPRSIKPGDKIVLNGDLARHGMAIMSKREGLEFESDIKSDCASLAAPVAALLAENLEIHCMRDLTRGGLASALNEISKSTGFRLAIKEALIPVQENVASACEILGLDPLYVANEGRFIAILPPEDAQAACRIMNQDSPELEARVIGTVEEKTDGLVIMQSRIGAQRILDSLSGDLLPRIC